VQFDQELKESLVRTIASLEPGQNRRLRPRDKGRYNRILPISRR